MKINTRMDFMKMNLASVKSLKNLKRKTIEM